MNLNDVIIAPVVTEKSEEVKHSVPGSETYTFKIQKRANKELVRQALHKLYGVKAEKVRVINVPSRLKRFRNDYARVPGWKKAIVTLSPGQSIDLAKAAG
ncbi:MAG: 50S ribosomal protein L23 [Leptospiraceae bacterium]|nr:50S ribosomal protein L23 [Leptospiraceae bacterium]MCB1302937.1 50S ribosomal protein L23 [Leptospiraceae bacterium]